MINWLKRVYVEILLVLAGYLLFAAVIDSAPEGSTQAVIRSDGKGYYDYLPAIFIHRDLNFKFREKGFDVSNTNHNVECNGYTINKYPCGLAILWAPFFATAHAYYKIKGDEGMWGGYGRAYQFVILLAALVYLFLGLLYLKKLLKNFVKSTMFIRCIQLVLLFATNLFLFAYQDPSFSHVYSFSLITVFFYSWVQLSKTGKKKYVYGLAVLLALIVLVRPFNILTILFLPFFSGGYKPFINDVKNMFVVQGRHFYMAVFSFLAIVSVQPLIWYLQCGQLLPWTYSKETFHFTKPVLFKTLFGFKKGLFIYTPILLLCGFAFVKLIKQKKTALIISLTGAFLVLHYVISSWQTWWYGGSFGLRPYIDFYSVFSVMGAIAFVSVRYVFKWMALVFVSICLFLNIFQSWQFTRGIIAEETMTAKGYAAVFLKTDLKYGGWLRYKGFADECRQLKVKRTLNVLSHDTLVNPGEWRAFDAQQPSNKKEGKYCFVMDMEVTGDVNPDVFIDYGMQAERYGYQQQSLFHLTGEETGRQKAHYFFEFNEGTPGGTFKIGFLKLDKPVKIYSIVLQELD